MLKKIATSVGLIKAPRMTILMKYPKKGAKTLLAWKGAKMAARNPVATALGAAVVLPAAVMAFRRMAGSH